MESGVGASSQIPKDGRSKDEGGVREGILHLSVFYIQIDRSTRQLS